MKDIGLILEGGGMRGVYTAGVLDYFLDNDLLFDPIYGVSAGACHACSYLSRQRGRAIRTVVDYARDRRYASYYSLLTTGDFFGVDYVYREIPDELLPFDYDAFAGAVGRFYAVLTDCTTGEAEYARVGDLPGDMTKIQASSSLPLLSRQVVIDGTPYLDGGIADSIPVIRAQADGYTRQVVVLTQHREYVKPPTGMMAAIRLRYRRQPELVRSIATRHRRYNDTLDHIRREERAGNLFVLAPEEPVTIGRLERDMDKLRALYRRGYDDTARQGEALRAFLQTSANQAV